MKKLFILLLCIPLIGCQEAATLRTTTSNRQQMQHSNSVSNISSDDSSVLEPDGYGLGVHKNRYGQPVRLEPDFGGVYGERLEIKTDGYGMGVHMDQYGRPVREKKWP